MPLDRDAVAALSDLVGPSGVDATPEALRASSHDTWPLSTKQAMGASLFEAAVTAGRPAGSCA